MWRPGCEPESLIATQRRPVAKKEKETGTCLPPLPPLLCVGTRLALNKTPKANNSINTIMCKESKDGNHPKASKNE